MAIEIVRGATLVRRAVESHLESWVPQLIDQARISWDVSPESLPYPKRYDAWDPWEVQEYPIVGAYVTRTREFARVNNGATGSPYRPAYALQVALWAEDPRFDGVKYRDPRPENAVRVANDLTAILRSALLEFPNLGQPEVFTFEEGTYSEDYITAQKTMGQENWVAGAALSFQLHVNEANLLRGASIGMADTATMDAFNVGPSQLFPMEVAP